MPDRDHSKPAAGLRVLSLQDGFTLIELLVVLLILSIGYTGLSFVLERKKPNQVSLVAEISSQITYVRDLSIRTGNAHGLLIDKQSTTAVALSDLTTPLPDPKKRADGYRVQIPSGGDLLQSNQLLTVDSNIFPSLFFDGSGRLGRPANPWNSDSEWLAFSHPVEFKLQGTGAATPVIGISNVTGELFF